MANDWTILGKDLISEVTCKEPYEWKDLTDKEWEFSKAAQAQAAEKPFHVRPHFSMPSLSARQLTPESAQWIFTLIGYECYCTYAE